MIEHSSHVSFVCFEVPHCILQTIFLQYCYISQHLLTYFSDLEWKYASIHHLSLWIIQGAIYWSILHIRLAACVSVLDRVTSSHPRLFFFIFPSQLSSLPLFVLATPFLSVLSPSPPSILLPLPASVLFLITPFIKDYKYFFPCLLHFRRLVLFLLSAFWRLLTFLFRSISRCLSAILVSPLLFID